MTLASPAASWEPGAIEPPPDQEGGIEDGQIIWTEVAVDSSLAGAPATLTPSYSDWQPPVCWMEPLFTPEEFADEMKDERAHTESAHSDWLAEIREADYHRGEDGNWWGLVYNPHLPEEDAQEQCGDVRGNPVWVEEGEVPEEGTAISPELLAEIAYSATRLPEPAIELSPPAADQRVNLDTHVSMNSTALPASVTTTASINYPGIEFAATVIAKPTTLHIDAGTEHANPRNCTYTLNDEATLNTASADCNITYRKASRETPYPMDTRLTWDVRWVPSTDPTHPDSQPLPQGHSTTEHTITVLETQTIVR